MSGRITADPLGVGNEAFQSGADPAQFLAENGFEIAGPIGADLMPLDAGDLIITAVTKDWEPTPSFRTTPEIIVRGDTLAQVFDELNTFPEWGRGGGSLRTDRIPVGTSPTVTVNIH